MIFHYSPRAVLRSYEEKYGKHMIVITSGTMREMIHRIISLNDKYSLETVQQTLRYLINRQPVGEYESFEKLHTMVTDNVPEWYEDCKSEMCGGGMWCGVV